LHGSKVDAGVPLEAVVVVVAEVAEIVHGGKLSKANEPFNKNLLCKKTVMPFEMKKGRNA
jgi:hypothetical protein